MDKINCMNCEALKEIIVSVKELDKRVSNIEAEKELQNFKYEQIISTLTEIKGDIRDIKEKPNKRWDLVATTVITSVITGIIAFAIGKLF